LKFKRTLKVDEEGIPITNLVDVLFLLVVFFMVSTVLSYDRGIGVSLPETKAAGTISNKGVVVLVDKGGKVYVDGTEVPLERLGGAVKERMILMGQTVILKSDKDTRYQAIAEVMDRLLDIGVTDLSLPVLQRTEAR
jgi:biopolymer transport protein ExbD